MKLSDYRNEDAIDILADLLEPSARILGDKKLQKAISNKLGNAEYIKISMKNHPKDLIEILCIIDGIKRDQADYSTITIINRFLELLNDKELNDFFSSQVQNMGRPSSSSATETTGAEEV